jgi:hypothetical protein
MAQDSHLIAKSQPTKRAPDVWDSAAFSSIFLASGFSCFQAESTPAHTQVTQSVGLLKIIKMDDNVSKGKNHGLQ